MSEDETRAGHIDPALRVAGWGVARQIGYRRVECAKRICK